MHSGVEPLYKGRELSRIRTNAVYQVLRRRSTIIWITLLLSFTGLFISQQMAQIRAMAAALQQADLRWVYGVVALQMAVLGLGGVVYQVVLGRLSHRLSWRQAMRLHLQRQVIGTVTPAGGPASIYVFVRSLSERGVPADDALLATTLRSVAGYGSFVLLMLPVLVLYQATPLVLVGAGILGVLFVLMLAGMLLLFRQAPTSKHCPKLAPARVFRFVERARSHRIRAHDLLTPFGLMLLHNLAGVTLLYLSLLAVGQQPSPATALIAYVIGTLLTMVAPVFGGIGVVEVTIALVLSQLGVPAGAAAGAAVLFRLADLWLPLGVGLLVQAIDLPPFRLVALRSVAMVRAAPTALQRPALLDLSTVGVLLIALAVGYLANEPALLVAAALVAVTSACGIALRRRVPEAAIASAGGAFALLPTFIFVYAGTSVDPDVLMQFVHRLG